MPKPVALTDDDKENIDSTFEEEMDDMAQDIEIRVPTPTTGGLPEGKYPANVASYEAAGPSKFKPGVIQILFKFKLEDKNIELRDWINNTWWWKDPAPSKLFRLCKATGIVENDVTPPVLRQIIGKKVILKLVKNEAGYSRIKEYISPEE